MIGGVDGSSPADFLLSQQNRTEPDETAMMRKSKEKKFSVEVTNTAE